ncbi:unnamed protein product [Pleuronectes platessa]|uniref:Uncharacterized protein n=1 Tax=Pleuronectes platessa TaxID=8262 RepID=A0A9N7Y8M4_PLEPL|nr:unnamed protein product [Pleuronectes platessa]
MRSLGALGVALHASLLVLLAQGFHRSRDGVFLRPQHRLPVSDRTTGHHLPTYMVHLYRNFKANFSGTLDTRGAGRSEASGHREERDGQKHKRWVATFDLNNLPADKRIQAAELESGFLGRRAITTSL